MPVEQATRKSCDFCYERRLKCDARSPRCSTCVSYQTQCTHLAPKRRSNTKRQREQLRLQEDAATAEARLIHVEARLEHLSAHLLGQPHLISGLTILPSTVPEVTASNGRDLPTPHHVKLLVEMYLSSFNSVLPLFHPGTLLKLVGDYHSNGHNRDNAVRYAAINVVLALAHKHAVQGTTDSTASARYLSKVQGVITAVVEAEPDLLNVQILLGMVILLQSSPNQQPALIYIAVALRLAHKIRLHDRSASVDLDPDLAQQRANVFWMAYILDKDLSMRQKQPSIQRDDDIYHDLSSGCDDTQPGLANSHDGVLITADGAVTWNYFRARTQLAVIQGGVYDYLYSTRSQRRTPDERAQALSSVARALDQWKQTIAPAFGAAAATENVSPELLPFISHLHATSLLCNTLINQAHAWNAQWMDSLQISARLGTMPSVPPAWDSIVEEARSLVKLIQALPLMDSSNFWLSGCTYMTAMMLLITNTLHRPDNDFYPFDSQLVDVGMKSVDSMLDESGHEAFKHFRATFAELRQDAWRRRTAAMTVLDRPDLYN